MAYLPLHAGFGDNASSLIYFTTKSNPDTRLMAFSTGIAVVLAGSVVVITHASGSFVHLAIVAGITMYYALMFLPLPFYLKTRRIWILCIQIFGILAHLAIGTAFLGWDPGG